MSSPDRAELNRPADEQAASNFGADVAAEMQALFLIRLRELLAKRYAGSAKFTDEQRLLIDRAIYATFCDCLELGVSSQARALLREVQES
jgi:hypothetical protein